MSYQTIDQTPSDYTTAWTAQHNAWGYFKACAPHLSTSCGSTVRLTVTTDSL